MIAFAIAGLLCVSDQAKLESHITRGVQYLVRSQKTDGSFGRSDAITGDVGTTGLAVQALADSALEASPERLRAIGRGLRFLENRIQADGLAYDPSEGLRVFKTAMAARAFSVSNIPRYRARAVELMARIGSATRFESQSTDDAQAAEGFEGRDTAELLKALSAEPGTDQATDRAIAFLLQLDHSTTEADEAHSATASTIPHDQPGYVSYESLPSLIYRDLRLEDADVIAVLKALREKFTLAENPDLTRRFARQSKSAGEQGLYFNLLVVARVLSLLPDTEFVTDSGARHDWVALLSQRLCSLQMQDGSWANSDPRWWEGSPALTTSYAILTLRLCQARSLADIVNSPPSQRK